MNISLNISLDISAMARPSQQFQILTDNSGSEITDSTDNLIYVRYA